MRETKTFKIDDREILVKEITMEGIMKFLSGGDETQKGGNFFAAVVDMAKGCVFLNDQPINMETAQKMAPSELLKIWEALKEVNAAFLAIAGFLGLNDVLKSLVDQWVQELTAEFKAYLPALLDQATTKPAAMGTHFSDNA